MKTVQYVEKTRSLTLLAIVSAIVGCSQSPPLAKSDPNVTKSRKETIAGLWKGEHKEDPAHPKEGTGSNYLANRLGGYSLRLMPDGRFLADWRGLTKEGTWKIDQDTVHLTVVRVFGKDRQQSQAENTKEGKLVNDLMLFESDNILRLSADNKTITLTANDKGAETVVFKHYSD